jgi:PAS domain-containing protein
MAGEPMMAASADVERVLAAAVVPPPAWIVEALTVRRRALSLTVAHWDELFDVRVVRGAAFYNEVARPHRLIAPVTMLGETGDGPLPAVLSVYFADERSARIHARRRKELLQLLFPSFRAGLDAFLRFRRNSAALRALAEDADIGVLMLDPSGVRARENDFFRQLMSSQPERERVRAEAKPAMRGATSLPSSRG